MRSVRRTVRLFSLTPPRIGDIIEPYYGFEGRYAAPRAARELPGVDSVDSGGSGRRERKAPRRGAR